MEPFLHGLQHASANAACLMLHSLRLQGPQLRFQHANVLLQPCNRLPPYLYRAVKSVPAECPYPSGCLLARYTDCWAKHGQGHLQQLGVNGACAQGSSVLLPLAFEQFLLHKGKQEVRQHCWKLM
jgi:hypothetical protein